ncbi:DUF1028 domain-containing protein [Bradyrhizobium prioriisuperbiae]|uniref:DUF1028 domain-containing protein n=1 Tax=Bradyrhizobium prioriisuperbiae TaxID=2854389 RepID=UPI0028E2ACE7|nr:DUF1028 domain-containing protein [Bradyrhizobium prioritasuperba]
MTFSIVARCSSTGMLGMAVSSSSPSVAARCAHVRADVGAFATQNFTDPTLGRRGLDLMERGANATQTIEIISATANDREYRQLAAVGKVGAPAIFTGAKCMDLTGSAVTSDAAAVGNLLASVSIPSAMVESFDSASGHLAYRLIRAMQAGLQAGGEIEPVRSAGLVVVHELPWAIVDLRVDWTEGCPIGGLQDLWNIWEPRMPIYLARALRPAEAPTTDVEAVAP